MLAAMHGKLSCVKKLLEAGANVGSLSFSSPSDTQKLKKLIFISSIRFSSSIHCTVEPVSITRLTTATSIACGKSSPPLIPIQSLIPGKHFFNYKGNYWSELSTHLFFRGFARFVNVRDGDGGTPLHLAARQRRSECVHLLLDNGALVCATTGSYR